MVYINIPYVSENEKIDRQLFIKELSLAEISEEARFEAYEAVYNRLPRGVNFEFSDTDQVRELLSVLLRMRIAYRITTEPEYPSDLHGG